MDIRLFDSLSGTKKKLEPVKPGEVSVYYCGPTVYNYVHLGNIRPVIVFDVLFRTLRALGYQVKAVSNYTDIDDKIINGALKEGVTEKELSEKYIRAYEDVTGKLNLLPLFKHPKASETIQKMQDFISALVKNGYAYKAGDDVYFRVSKIKDYGAVSHISLEDNQAGKRIEVRDLKENPADFALWKKTDDQGIKFDSPFGAGRPGWHTECVVMIKDVFQQPVIDIHGGGFDLKFPHHENERAQSIGYDGTGLANIWMHVGFLTAAHGEKMSKSLGNVVLAKDCLDRYSGNALRLFFASTNYRAPIAYSDEALTLAQEQADRYVSALTKLAFRIQLAGESLEGGISDQETIDKILAFLADDLNIANALTLAEKKARQALTLLRSDKTPVQQLKDSYATLQSIYEIVGLSAPVREITAEEKKLYADYRKARADKDFAASDRLRAELTEKGIL